MGDEGRKTEAADLETHLILCRRYGVLEWEGHGVRFKLAEQLAVDPTFVAPSTPKSGEVQAEFLPKREQKVGADGLTAEMQDELFMRPMDATKD